MISSQNQYQFTSDKFVSSAILAFEFQDNCLQTYGSYKTEQEVLRRTSSKSKTPLVFEVFPNPNSFNKLTTILSSEDGSLMVYDIVGKRILNQKIVKGMNILRIQASKGLYNFIFDYGQNQNSNSKFIIDE
jgi:hypothetical protein